MKKGLSFLACLLVPVFIFTGCSNSKETASEQAVQSQSQQPVTVTVGINPTGYLNEDEFQRYFIDPVGKKYPWITVQRVPYVKGSSLTDLVSAGETPDLVIQNNVTGMSALKDLQLSYPITDLIKKYNLDLSRFEPEALEAVKAAMQQDYLIGLPYTWHFCALYYNKDIFDKFGVPYPKDGITWDQAYDLANRLTRKEENVQYRGLETNKIQRPLSQLSLPYADPNTNKPLFNNDKVKRVFDFILKIREIPGNSQITYNSAANDLFAKDRTLAMLASNNIIFDGNLYKFPDLNWDMASYPTWPEAPGIGLAVDEHVAAITSTSPHKDADFLVLSVVTSDEVQMDMSRQGRLSILNNQKIKDSFGADMDFMKGKNIQAIYKTKPSKPYPTSKYDGMGMSLLSDAMKNAVNKKIDVNTALRQAEEDFIKKVNEQEEGQ